VQAHTAGADACPALGLCPPADMNRGAEHGRGGAKPGHEAPGVKHGDAQLVLTWVPVILTLE